MAIVKSDPACLAHQPPVCPGSQCQFIFSKLNTGQKEPDPCSFPAPLEYKKDTVNHPDHYGGEDDIYEAIKVIEAWGLDFCLGNCLKYIRRAGVKSREEIEDLMKARWYLDRRIHQLKKAKSL